MSEKCLKHFPVALFTTVMGMTGLTLAWFKVDALGWSFPVLRHSLLLISSALFLGLIITYAIKFKNYPDSVKTDWNHPVRQNFFPAISIGLVLLGTAWQHSSPTLGLYLWTLGAVLHLIFTLLVINGWLHTEHILIQQASPAWFIPVVGNILIPIAGVKFTHPDLCWFFFSTGLIFWIILMTIILYRLFFHEAMPTRLTPTLFILLAPPSIGFLAYLAITNSLDSFAHVLYSAASFIFLLLLTNLNLFLKTPFFLSAWAYSFPLAAFTLATIEMSTRSNTIAYAYFSYSLLIALSFLLALLSIKTLLEAFKGNLCVPE